MNLCLKSAVLVCFFTFALLSGDLFGWQTGCTRQAKANAAFLPGPLSWIETPATHSPKSVGTAPEPPASPGTRAVLYASLLLATLPGALLLALLLYLRQRVTRPLRQLRMATHRVAKGDLDIFLPEKATAEIGHLIQAFQLMLSRLALRRRQFIENERRLSAIIDNATAALVTMDRSGTLCSFNSNAEQIFGYTAGEVIGRNVRILMPMPHRSRHDRYIHRYLKSGVKRGHSITQEVKGRRKNGEVFPIWLAVSEIKATENELFVASILDITHQKRTDEELANHRDNLRTMIHERTKDLKVAMEKAEAANLAKSNFISNISHEIRTPMNSVLGFLALALDNDALPKELRRYLECAHRSSWSLLGLLDDILDISKLEGGHLELEVAPFNLARLLRDITRAMAVAAEEKGLSLRLEISPRLPECCTGDPIRLRQVLFNLLSNAVKFTHKGGVEIHAEALNEDQVHFFIQDTGIGIAKSQLTRIFEPFAQADDSSTRPYGGTGLGTAIAKQLTELMGGTIWAQSEVGKGSTFHLTLTLPTAETEQPSHPPRETVCPSPPGGLAILVAEDVAENAKLIMIRLEQKGHRATFATNGREVLQALARAPFHLILMDVHMPDLDGLEATRRIRRGGAGDSCRTIPIIGLTASSGKQDVQACLDAGMDEVVPKPIDFKHLYTTIHTIMTGRVAHDPAPDTLPRPPAPWPHAHGIDTRKAMQIWGDKAVYFQALSSFVQKAMASAHALRQATEEGNAAALHEQIHAIKGASANLCMTEVHSACEALTPLMAAGETKGLRPLVEALINAIEALSRTQRHGPSEEPPRPQAPLNLPVEKVRNWFQALLSALESDNPDRVAPLLTPDAACIAATHLRRLQHKVDAFDFRGAEQEAQKTARKMNIELPRRPHDG